jgi:hypothetical protein
MRWTRIQCDYCQSDTLAPVDDPVLRGWKHDPVTERDACPTCVWAIDCGEEPGPAVHTTVRPLPPASRTQRPAQRRAACVVCGNIVWHGDDTPPGYEARCLPCAIARDAA